MSATLYETDLAAWAVNSAALLREGAELDAEQREQIAEELEAMARNDRRERNSRTITLLTHLLKIHYQPEKRSRSWDVTVALQRGEIEELLEESPSLRYAFLEELPKLYSRAKKLAEAESGLACFPSQNPFTLEQILQG